MTDPITEAREDTPTAAEVDEYFAIRRERAVEGWYAPEAQDRARKEWDLMLAAHDARVRAEALRAFADAHRMPEVLFRSDKYQITAGDLLRAEADRIEKEAGA